MHEHLDDFALINMNGRVYDPQIARFLSPDPQLQSPGYWLNYNRYGYALNNPLKYTDPDGEFFIEAMIIGAFINTFIQGASGNINSAGDFFLSMGIGALSGAAGYGAGQLVAGAVGTIGFAGGAMTGAAGGFAGGFVGGAGNAWAGGASFGQGLGQGLIGGGFGAVTGGLVGGISGGITATKHGGKFWSGEGATFDALGVPGDIIEIGEGKDYSNEYAQTFSNENFGTNVKGVNDLYADGTLPPGYSTKGDVVLNASGKSVRGSTMYLGTGKGSNVYLYKAAFASKEQLYFTMGHEYLHAGYFSTGLMNTKSQHASIYKWEAQQAKLWGFNETYYARRYVAYKPHYNSAYDYSKLGFFLLSIKPW
jgi:RHS repeat-associated protein